MTVLAKIPNRDYTEYVVSDLKKGRIMDRCPSCNARYAGKPTCHRCGTDLSRLAAIEAEARDRLTQASAACSGADYEAMYQDALRSCRLRRTPSADTALAIAALLTRRFDIALGQWARIADAPDGEPAPS